MLLLFVCKSVGNNNVPRDNVQCTKSNHSVSTGTHKQVELIFDVMTYWITVIHLLKVSFFDKMYFYGIKFRIKICLFKINVVPLRKISLREISQ